MFGSADLGRPRWVETFANHYGADLALVRKKRIFKKTQVEGVIGDVRGTNVVIYDDMTRSGESLIQSADAYLERGALSVCAILSHLALNNPSVIDLLEYSKIRRIVALNSHPMSMEERVQRSKKFIIKDISPNYARAIEQLL
jgi:ribose-phosphate pyrophosphokinase